MILLTGATGSLGSYLVEALLQISDEPLCLLVRTPEKLVFPYYADKRVQVICGDIQDISVLKKRLAQARILIHAATAWGGDETFRVNVKAPLNLLDALDPNQCEAIFHFSTASVLRPDSEQPCFESQTLTKGTEYIRSKAVCTQRLKQHPLADKITVLYPTVIIGGDNTHHYTPLTQALVNLPRWLAWARFLKAEGTFHWIHAEDIARMLATWIAQPLTRPAVAVLGNGPHTVQALLQASCDFYGLRYRPLIALEPFVESLLWGLAPWMNPWDRFSLKQRHLVYPVINAESLGLASRFSHWPAVLGAVARTFN